MLGEPQHRPGSFEYKPHLVQNQGTFCVMNRVKNHKFFHLISQHLFCIYTRESAPRETHSSSQSLTGCMLPQLLRSRCLGKPQALVMTVWLRQHSGETPKLRLGKPQNCAPKGCEAMSVIPQGTPIWGQKRTPREGMHESWPDLN